MDITFHLALVKRMKHTLLFQTKFSNFVEQVSVNFSNILTRHVNVTHIYLKLKFTKLFLPDID